MTAFHWLNFLGGNRALSLVDMTGNGFLEGSRIQNLVDQERLLGEKNLLVFAYLRADKNKVQQEI